MSAAPQLASTASAAIPAPVDLGKASIASRAIQVLFGSVVSANVLSMSLMNFFESASSNTAFVYASCLAAILLLQTRHLPRLPGLTLKEHLLCLGLGLALFLPRFGYLIEELLGYSVNVVCWDDTNHLQEMSSIVHSVHFPPRATYDNSQYLTYYYAPWMLSAALYWSGIASTVKQAFGLTYLLQSFFFVYGAMYASRVLFLEQRLQNLFLASCLLYGGFDFLYWLIFNFAIPPPYPEWWAVNFGFNIHYSSFLTLATWVQHHTLSAMAILYGLFLTIRSKHSIVHALAGVLFLSATFSSTFTVIGAIPIIAWFLLRHKLLNSAVLAAFIFLLFSLPLWWILLGKSETAQLEIFGTLHPFWQDHKKEAFLVFLLLISLELMPLIACAFVFIRKQRDLSNSILFSLCFVFLLSTFFVSFSIGNNYVRQGSILPIFALTYLATPALSEWIHNSRHIWTYVVIVAYSLSGPLGYTSLWHSALLAYSKSNTNLNAAILRHNKGTSDLTSAELVARGGADAWLLMERERPSENPVSFWHVATMNSDNRYRITASRLFGPRQTSGPND